ncbi:hypothetical protein IT575_13455 [bacterium]|nr:hypothetical protein [bacterium]
MSADNIQDGSAFFSAHPGVEVQGTQLRLEGGAGYEWAVYSFDPGVSALLQVEVSQAVSAGSAYLAVPDYEAGRWVLTGPHSGSVGSNLAYPGARNGAGVTYCAVIAPAGAINTIQTVNFITDAGGGTFPITVDAQDGTGWDPHAAIVQGRPAIAYADYGTSEGADGDLTYVIADDAQGSSWGEPLVVDSNGDTGHSPSMLIVDGNPAIAYHKFDEEILMYVRAADATGSSWGSPVIVDQSNSVGGYPHMELVAGRPAIIHLMWPLGDNPELMYVRADDSTGAAWPAGESLATFAVTEEVSDTWSMEVVNGNPAVAFSDSSSGPLFFRRASNAEGGAWNDAVQVSTGTIQWNDLHVDAGGNPCISFYDAFTGVLKYARASDANGSAWGSAVVVDDRSNTGWFSDLVLFNGLPVIGYYSLLNGNLGFAMADDANGSAWSDLRTLDEAGNTGGIPTLLPLGDGSTLGVAYFDVDNQDLRWIGDIS